jgi:iron complex transport system substrate-binding protein
MNKNRILIFLSLLLLLAIVPLAAAQEGEWPRTLVDGLGTEITLNEPPQKILSVSLGTDEVLLPLIGPERFVAVTSLALDPGISNVALTATQVPDSIEAATDTEKIISLEPDVVFVASFTAPEIIQQLRDAGLTVFATGFPVGLDAIRENIRLLGQAVGAEEAAEAMIANMDAQLAEISAAIGTQETPVSALYLTPGNYTSGIDSTISEVIGAAGGSDVTVAGGVTQFAPITDEFIIEQDPDVILLSGWTPWDPTFIDTFKNNPAFAGSSAVTNNRVYVASDAHLTTVSQFIVEGVKDAAAYLYPEQYPAFPITVTDAAGNEVAVEGEPAAVYGVALTSGSLLEEFVAAMGSDLTVSLVDDETGITSPENALIFTENTESVLPSVVVLYDGDTPAEVVANTEIISQVLGERVVALDWIAQYTDQLEAQAAGQ